MLGPVQPSYTIGGFSFSPPASDGWRQLTQDREAFRLVYAEDLGEGRINTRMEVTARAFAIPDPDLVSDAATLAQTSQTQQASDRGEGLIAFSRVAQLAGAKHVHWFTLVSKVGDKDLQEAFFVALAPDKSEYFVAKLATTETDYAESPYFKPFVESLSSLGHSADEAKDPDASGHQDASDSEQAEE